MAVLAHLVGRVAFLERKMGRSPSESASSVLTLSHVFSWTSAMGNSNYPAYRVHEEYPPFHSESSIICACLQGNRVKSDDSFRNNIMVCTLLVNRSRRLLDSNCCCPHNLFHRPTAKNEDEST